MNQWLSRGNFALFRQLLEHERDATRRQELQRRLAEEEAEYEASLAEKPAKIDK